MLRSDPSQASAFRRLDEYMLNVKENLASGAALCIVHRDVVVHEWHDGSFDFKPGSRPITSDSQFHLGSIRKTYLGFAVSLAIEEGLIASVDDFAAEYLDDVDRTLLGDAAVTIRHLLTHTHGLLPGGGSTVAFAPGTGWSYNSAGVDLLIRIVGRVFGRPLAEVLRERVFRPLGFSQTDWRAEPAEQLVWMNEVYGGDRGDEANLFASAKELAYWGYLHLAKGRIGGQIAPASVFERAVSVTAPDGLPADCPRNGFFWWVQDRPSTVSELGPSLPAGAYQSLGIYGCAVLVLPSHDAVVVRMLNALKPNPPGYDYLADIRGFGDLVIETLEYASIRE